MHIVPAIYLQNGKVVSLYKGSDNEEKKRYQKAGTSYAKLFQDQGADTLFVIDLDGDQRERLTEYREVFQGTLWWAGQIRSMEALAEAFEKGADAVILGQSAASIHEEALALYGTEKIIVGLQFQHYEEAPDICEALGSQGFKRLILKDLNAEGTLFQPNFDLMEKCNYFSSAQIYASGGVSQPKHIELLKQAGVKGFIVARALYEHQLNLQELLMRYPND
jgi:phosphoribosylformimino-5-aminoimidazole carboxamide ribotide isomerase